MFKHIIFDLDGTLIDSAPSILSCIKTSLIENKISPICPLTFQLIGPPLELTFKRITGIEDQECLNKLTQTFKTVYDFEGYKHSVPYAGVDLMLQKLKLHGMELHLATNKRKMPTLKILEHFLWKKYFNSVYTPDFMATQFKDKATMLDAMLDNENLTRENAIYIGDIYDDFIAAKVNRISFAFAEWGYEKKEFLCPISVSSSEDLIKKLFDNS